MEEGQGVEEQHEAMRQDVVSRLTDLWRNPDLWANSRGEPIDKLVKAVLIMSTRFSRALARGRRRWMEEGQDVEQDVEQDVDVQRREAMSQDVMVSGLTHFWANPGLWVKIPGDLIDELIAAVLIITPPLSRVGNPFFLAWKEWRNFRLSMARSMRNYFPHLLYFRNLHECITLNPMTGFWESMPLLFSSGDMLRLQHMELISCDGGLLYFASAETGELIVGNPLTRRCSATLRGLNAAQRIAKAEGKTRKSYDPSGGHSGLRFHVALWEPRFGCRKDIVVDTCVFAHFQLEVSRLYLSGTTTESLTLKDSRRVNWELVLKDVSKGTFHSLCFPTIQMWKERVQESAILGFFECPLWQGFYVLLYDIAEQIHHWLWCQTLPLPSSRTLCASVDDRDCNLNISEFVDGGQDGGVKLARAPFPPSTNVLHPGVPYEELRDRTTIPQFDAMFNFVYVQQGDDEYQICFFRHDLRRGEVNISVREQNQVTGLQRISNWARILPSASEHVPSSKQFHIFRPSFSSP